VNKENKLHAINKSLIRLAYGICLSLGLGIAVVSTAVLAQPDPQGAQAAKDPYPQLPAGDGRALLISTCGKCHSPAHVTDVKGQTSEGWGETIQKMVGYGATGTDEELTQIVDYLAKSFPPAPPKVNINKATATEIESQLGFTAKQAQDIVAYREKAGAFKTIDDLKKVPQLDAKDVDAKQDKIAFE
jgi:competence protein ComEA